MGFSPRADDRSQRIPREPLRISFERRIAGLIVLLTAPGLLISGILIWFNPWILLAKLLLLGAEVFLCWLQKLCAIV
jgi:hypothetical protein